MPSDAGSSRSLARAVFSTRRAPPWRRSRTRRTRPPSTRTVSNRGRSSRAVSAWAASVAIRPRTIPCRPMAAREPAHPLEKRDLLHAGQPNRARIAALVDKMASEGRWPEAIDYLEIAPDDGRIAKARADAIARGSAWLLQQVERISGKKAEPPEWVRLSESAARAERWRDAVRALASAGEAEKAEALRLEKCPDYDPFKPLGK